MQTTPQLDCKEGNSAQNNIHLSDFIYVGLTQYHKQDIGLLNSTVIIFLSLISAFFKLYASSFTICISVPLSFYRLLLPHSTCYLDTSAISFHLPLLSSVSKVSYSWFPLTLLQRQDCSNSVNLLQAMYSINLLSACLKALKSYYKFYY